LFKMSELVRNEVDWTKVGSLDEEVVKASPNLYIRIIVLKKDWNKLILSGNNPIYTEEVINSLRFQLVSKAIFKDKNAQEIVDLLDLAQKNVRYQLLLILVENFDKLPVAAEVGQILAKTVSERPWVFEQPAIFSLQPQDVLKRILISPYSFTRQTYQTWQQLFGQTENSDSKEHKNVFVLTFNNPREWLPRKSFGDAVVDAYIEASDENRSSANECLQAFKDSWFSNKSLKLKVFNHILKHSDTTTSFYDFFSGHFPSYDDYLLPIIFTKWNISDDSTPKVVFNLEWIMKNVALVQLQSDLNETSIPYRLGSFLSQIISGSLCTQLQNFLLILRDDADTWTKIKVKLQEYILKKVLDKDFTNFLNLVKCLEITSYQTPNNRTHSYFSYDEILSMVTQIVTSVMDKKAEIVIYGADTYSEIMQKILSSLLLLSANGAQSLQTMGSYSSLVPLFLIPVDLKDRILVEAISHPNKTNPLAFPIFQWKKNDLLKLFLCFDSFELMGKTLPFGFTSKLDKYGFYIQPQAFSVPPLPNAVKNLAVSITAPMHPWVKELIKSDSLTSTNDNVVLTALNLFKTFVLKMLNEADKSNDPEFLKRAVALHYHICRLCIAKQRDEVVSNFVTTFNSLIVHPLAIKVGLKADPDFAKTLYTSLIQIIPPTTMNNNQPLIMSVIYNLLDYSGIFNKSYNDKIEFFQPRIESDKEIFALFDETCAKLLTDSISQLSSQVFSAFRPFHVSSPVSVPCNEINKFFIEAKRLSDNHWVTYRVDEKYKNLIIKNIMGKKAAKEFRYPAEFTAENRSIYDETIKVVNQCNTTMLFGITISTVSDFVPGFQTLSALLRGILPSISGYQPENHSKPYSKITLSFCKYVIANLFRSVSFVVPKLPESMQNKFTRIQYTQLVNKCTFQFMASRVTIKTFANLLKSLSKSLNSANPSTELLIKVFDSEELYGIIEQASVFDPYPPETEKVLQLNEDIHILSKITVRFEPNPEDALSMFKLDKNVDASNFNVEPRKLQGDYKLFTIIAEPIVNTLLNLDATEKEKLFNYHWYLYYTVQTLSTMIPKLDFTSKTLTKNWVLIGEMIKRLFDDLLIMDPEPTEEEPNPATLPRFFSAGLFQPTNWQLQQTKRGKVMARSNTRSTRGTRVKPSAAVQRAQNLARNQQTYKPKPRRGVTTTPATSQGYTYNTSIDTRFLIYTDPKATNTYEYRFLGEQNAYRFTLECIAKCFDMIRSLNIILTLEQKKSLLTETNFADSINQFLSLEPSVISNKIGDDDKYHISESIAEMSICLEPFIETEAYTRLFGSELFVHGAVSALLSHIYSEVYEKRVVLVKQLTQIGKSGLSLTIHFLKNYVGLLMSPGLLSEKKDDPFIPDWALDAIDLISDDEKMHTDVKKAIIANSVAFFRFLHLSGNSPEAESTAHIIERIFTMLTKIFKSSSIKTIPIFCYLTLPDSFKQIASENSSIRELFPVSGYPELYVLRFPQELTLQFPRSDDFNKYFDRFVVNYVAGGLAIHSNTTLPLVIRILTDLHVTKGEVAAKIAEFLKEGISQFDPANSLVSLIEFAFSFCLSESNQIYKETIDVFISVFAKIRAYLDDLNKHQIRAIWIDKEKKNAQAYRSFNNVMETVIKSFKKKLSILTENDIETVSSISQRMIVALGDKSPSLTPDNWKHYMTYLNLALDKDLLRAGVNQNAEEAWHLLIKLIPRFYYLGGFWDAVGAIVLNKINDDYCFTLEDIKALGDYPIEVASNRQVQQYLVPKIEFGLSYHDDEDSPEFNEILMKLYAFSTTD